MLALWRRRKPNVEQVIREAGALIERRGEAAYELARSRRIEALQHQNRADHRFWCAVARAIARQMERKIGVDTSTRYTSSPCGRTSPRRNQ